MVSNTSKKCLLALVLFSSVTPISFVYCASNEESFFSKYSQELTMGCMSLAGAGVGYLLGNQHSQYQSDSLKLQKLSRELAEKQKDTAVQSSEQK